MTRANSGLIELLTDWLVSAVSLVMVFAVGCFGVWIALTFARVILSGVLR